jgi:hypothetical protein
MVIVHTTFNLDQGLGFLHRVSFLSYGFHPIYFQFITYIFLFLNFVLFEFYLKFYRGNFWCRIFVKLQGPGI